MGRWVAVISGLLLVLAAGGAAAQQQGNPAFQVGDEVEVSFHGSWYPAHVVRVVPPDRWEISYDQYDADWNQLVPAERLRVRQPPPPPPPPTPPPGQAVPSIARLSAGMRVMVEYHGSWYRGRVLGVRRADGIVRIRYVGYGREWDEELGLDRLRLPDKR
jgi:hypothetical protein